MLSTKGQQSAPFELLIGIILLGFVLLSGFIVMNDFSKKACENEAKKTLELVANEFESIPRTIQGRHFTLHFPDCLSNDTDLNIFVEHDAENCSNFCLGANQRCTLISLSNGEFFHASCLNFPQTASFLTAQVCRAQADAQEGFEAIDFGFGKALEEGTYYFEKNALSLSELQICSFRRKTTSP